MSTKREKLVAVLLRVILLGLDGLCVSQLSLLSNRFLQVFDLQCAVVAASGRFLAFRSMLARYMDELGRYMVSANIGNICCAEILTAQPLHG